jgi:hypothetical protein
MESAIVMRENGGDGGSPMSGMYTIICRASLIASQQDQQQEMNVLVQPDGQPLTKKLQSRR